MLLLHYAMAAHENLDMDDIPYLVSKQIIYSALSMILCCTAAGRNEASTVHISDAAQAYVLAIQHATPGSIYHTASGSATGEQIAAAIATKHQLKVTSIPRAEADELYGPILGIFFAMNNVNDSSKAQRELGWRPRVHNFLDSLAGKGQ